MPLPAAPVLPATTVVLDYDRTRATYLHTARWLRALALLVALPAVVAPFVDFTFSVSPSEVMSEFSKAVFHRPPDSTFFIVLLALPFFLGIVIASRRLRLLVREPTSRPERISAMLLSLITALMTLAFFGYGLYCWIAQHSMNNRDLASISIGAGVVVLGTVLLWWLRHIRLDTETLASVALNIAYLGNATLCLVEFCENRDPGWWWTFWAAVPMSLEICWVTFRSLLPRGAAG